MRNHSGTYAGIPISDNATAMSAVVYKVMIWVANANMKRFAAIDRKECDG